MISLAHRFLFVHIPKTAGNAIQRALVPFSEDRIILTAPRHDGVNMFAVESPTIEMHKHLTLREYAARLPARQFTGLLKISGIRNPWDRCVSYFFSPHRGQVTWTPEAFEAFIRDKVHPADHYVRMSEAEVDPFDNLDVILRFETLHEDFAAVCTRIGIGPQPLPKANVGNRQAYRDYYPNDRLIELVATKFRPEIDRFGYSFA